MDFLLERIAEESEIGQVGDVLVGNVEQINLFTKQVEGEQRTYTSVYKLPEFSDEQIVRFMEELKLVVQEKYGVARFQEGGERSPNKPGILTRIRGVDLVEPAEFTSSRYIKFELPIREGTTDKASIRVFSSGYVLIDHTNIYLGGQEIFRSMYAEGGKVLYAALESMGLWKKPVRKPSVLRELAVQTRYMKRLQDFKSAASKTDVPATSQSPDYVLPSVGKPPEPAGIETILEEPLEKADLSVLVFDKTLVFPSVEDRVDVYVGVHEIDSAVYEKGMSPFSDSLAKAIGRSLKKNTVVTENPEDKDPLHVKDLLSRVTTRPIDDSDCVVLSYKYSGGGRIWHSHTVLNRSGHILMGHTVGKAPDNDERERIATNLYAAQTRILEHVMEEIK